jgi:pimeloyl-ACP methyl ester carboxylesterase
LRQSYRSREVIAHAGVRIDLVSEGEGPLIVLLPSRGRDSEDFNDLAAALARAGFRVLRPQPRGAGLSVGPIDRISMRDLASDVAHVIEREKSGPAVVAGHAFGNWVARMVATAHPDLVRGVIVMAAAARSYPPGLREVVDAAGNEALPREARLDALRRGFFAPGHDPAEWLAGWAKDAIKAQATAVAATPQSEYWHAGTAPMLDIIAEHDPFRPRETWDEARTAYGDRVTTVTISGASHALIPEQPHAVADEIVRWMRRLPVP